MTSERTSRSALRVRRRRAIAWALLAVGCATTDVAPIGRDMREGALERDEQHIWKVSAALQNRLDRSGLLYRDAELERYVGEVAAGLFAEDFAAAGMAPRVRIVSDPDMNAFAFANGVVYLHTAILARIQNEAQLAILLAHELAHVVRRHALRGHRDVKNKAGFVAGVSTATAGLGGLGGLLLELGAVSSIYGFSRDLEREADAVGLERVAASRYDLRESPRLFELLREYQDELEEQGIDPPRVPYFLSSHPRLRERIESTRSLLAERYAAQAADGSRRRGEEPFRARVRELAVSQAALEVDAGRPRSALATLESALGRDPDHARAQFVRGQALEQQEGEEARGQAVAAYRRAIALDPALPAPHRALAFIHYRDGERLDAIAHFERYLELAPGATDRGYVEAYLNELRGGAGGGAGPT